MLSQKNDAYIAISNIIDHWKKCDKCETSKYNIIKYLNSISLEKYYIHISENINIHDNSLSKFLIKLDKHIQQNKIIKDISIKFQPRFDEKNSLYIHKISINGEIGYNENDFINNKINDGEKFYIEICEIRKYKYIYTALNWFDKIFDTNISFSNMEHYLYYFKLDVIPK